MKQNEQPDLAVLGGGPAGMAVAWYARQAGLSFRVYEAEDRVGGNCITLERDGFLFDSGAHRLHDKDPETTAIVQALLGDKLRRIQVPSQIFRDQRFIDFPLSPLNLLRYLGLGGFARAGFQILGQKLRGKRSTANFRELAVGTYGSYIAELFLLHYTEKLWGLAAEQLSTEVAGKRLKGLNLKTFVLEAFRGKQRKTTHLDGAFYYPERGIGTIFEAMRDACGPEHFALGHRISGIRHAQGRVEAIQVNEADWTPVNQLVCSLPLGLVLRLLQPAPPEEILRRALSIRFRNVLLIGLFLDKPTVNPNGSMYFPDASVPFTRVYEPRNRSPKMAPPGQTSLLVEIPCQPEDPIWQEEEKVAVETVIRHLTQADFFHPDELVGTSVYRIRNAYPILETGYRTKIEPIGAYLAQFKNLRMTGRNGLFAYSHIHDHLQNGRMIVTDLRDQLI
ncbi:MAG: FAD-dependent oxidoreductase [Bacteroidota bacterium]